MVLDTLKAKCKATNSLTEQFAEGEAKNIRFVAVSISKSLSNGADLFFVFLLCFSAALRMHQMAAHAGDTLKSKGSRITSHSEVRGSRKNKFTCRACDM